MASCKIDRGNHFLFGSVFIKKSNQTNFFLKKPKPNRNQVKPTDFGSVQFGFLGQKPVQTGLTRFSQFWLGFFGFGSVFFGLARFFRFWLGLALFFYRFFSVLVQFGFFGL
jgi:hypothetical protein